MQREINARTLTHAAAAGLFLASQALLLFVVVHWLIAELLAIEGSGHLVLGAVLAIPACMVGWKIATLAFAAETNPENHHTGIEP